MNNKESKTAEEILKKHFGSDLHGLMYHVEPHHVIAAMDEHAYQQCEALKEELDAWKKAYYELKEENERLKDQVQILSDWLHGQEKVQLQSEIELLKETAEKWHNKSDANEQCWAETVKDYQSQRDINRQLHDRIKALEEALRDIRDEDYNHLMTEGVSALQAKTSDRIIKLLNPTPKTEQEEKQV